MVTGNTVSSQRWYVRSLACTYREFVNYRLLFYLTTRKPSRRWESLYPIARWLQVKSLGRPRLISPLSLAVCRSFSSCLIHRLSPFRTTSSTSYKAKVFYQGGRTVKWKKKKRIAVGVSFLESLFAIVTQRDNRLREMFALAFVNFPTRRFLFQMNHCILWDRIANVIAVKLGSHILWKKK